jgi:hypothetical protein
MGLSGMIVYGKIITLIEFMTTIDAWMHPWIVAILVIAVNQLT